MKNNILKNIFINKKHVLYFTLLFFACTLLAALHWENNPYSLRVWVYASDSGDINIASRCEGQTVIAQENNLPVVAGYFEYNVSLPKCHLGSIEISGSDEHGNNQEISSAVVHYYGKEVYRLFGNKRTLVGQGIYDRDSRPSRAGSVLLASSLVLDALNFNAAEVRILWPRYTPLFLFPFAWWFSRMLASQQTSDKDKTGSSKTYAFIALVAFSLITAMAVVARTDVSVSPDELSHVASARYYYDHWLKPKIGAPETLDAHRTNVYGVGYLAGTDPIYQIASKFAVAIWPIFENDVIALRMFNVMLFGLLVLLAFRIPTVGLALIPVLATPQGWYIFSYFNGEGLPLFLSILVMVMFFNITKSDHPIDPRTLLKKLFWMGCMVGGILLSKPNYWVVLGVLALLFIAYRNYLTKGKFSLMALGWLFALLGAFLLLDNQIALPTLVRAIPMGVGIGLLFWTGISAIQKLIGQYKLNLRPIKPAVALVLGLVAVLGVKALDEARLNALPFTAARTAAQNAVMEATASHKYKVSSLETGAISKNRRMRDQGVGLRGLLFEKPWFRISVSSFLGVYGYLNIWPDIKHFSLTLLIMFSMVALSTLVLAGRTDQRYLGYSVQVSVFVGVVTMVAASVGVSWIEDYQPQGKYLLPILPILAAAGLFAGQYATKSKLLPWLVGGAFLLSVVSFLFVGIRWIPKMPGIF